MSTKLKIVPATGAAAWGAAVEFDEKEVRECLATPSSECIINESRKAKPRIYDVSKISAHDNITDKLSFKITIHIQADVTDTRLASLFSKKLKFKVYYEYIDNPATFAICILDPNYEVAYVMGYKQVRQTKCPGK